MRSAFVRMGHALMHAPHRPHAAFHVSTPAPFVLVPIIPVVRCIMIAPVVTIRPVAALSRRAGLLVFILELVLKPRAVLPLIRPIGLIAIHVLLRETRLRESDDGSRRERNGGDFHGECSDARVRSGARCADAVSPARATSPLSGRSPRRAALTRG